MRINSSLSRSRTFSTAYSIAFVASIRDESVSKKSRGFAAFAILDGCPGLDFEDDMDIEYKLFENPLLERKIHSRRYPLAQNSLFT